MKQGDWFSAEIEGTHCIGQLQLEDETWYLCQNKEDGAKAECKLGWKYSWSVGDVDAKSLRRNNVEDFKIISKEEAKKLGAVPPKFNIKDMPVVIGTFFDYEVKKIKNTYKFGCGEVVVTEKEIKDFLEIKKVNSVKVKNYAKIAVILNEQGIKDNAATIKTINKLLAAK